MGSSNEEPIFHFSNCLIHMPIGLNAFFSLLNRLTPEKTSISIKKPTRFMDLNIVFKILILGQLDPVILIALSETTKNQWIPGKNNQP